MPTPFGSVYVKMDANTITVNSDGGHGTLIIGDKNNERKIEILPGKEINVNL